MDEISCKIQELLEAIRRTDIYQEYRRQEELLHADPQLRERVNAFREDNFRMQNEASDEDLFAVAEEIYRESRKLRENLAVNTYLDAELALCKLVQKISRQLTQGIEMEVPVTARQG